jgi:hypothetical protein
LPGNLAETLVRAILTAVGAAPGLTGRRSPLKKKGRHISLRDDDEKDDLPPLKHRRRRMSMLTQVFLGAILIMVFLIALWLTFFRHHA